MRNNHWIFIKSNHQQWSIIQNLILRAYEVQSRDIKLRLSHWKVEEGSIYNNEKLWQRADIYFSNMVKLQKRVHHSTSLRESHQTIIRTFLFNMVYNVLQVSNKLIFIVARAPGSPTINTLIFLKYLFQTWIIKFI
ncbi:hypothetical protein TTHERM_000188352 (macronuclear) [Tetrahymena thermophila SB210]|uniref:Uncharacterized protein n=1 Tax=Tetrahymena thermophila (strain SB210) TaxID=312017 RepID=W7XJK0_TETTS|nr:hypothetical protein TTHERM_000188352 [Tetrahymena thermophila SB210]EWS74224.1 hypothetical protein TTHERM_000188352 [Tetrahymena thermophila SB210]|eukprot:XP_012653197.1 hypothetical protein TTHERM_000188352 [Tetrahymena thermophila SB210]